MRAKSQRDVSFTVHGRDFATIRKIAERFDGLCSLHGQRANRMSAAMDVTAVHANGNPLRLDDLLAADDFNFLHDLVGIENHLDRDTGTLRNCFVPRFTARRAA